MSDNLDRAQQAADAKKPYGDVSYADPGYQEDGKKRYPLDSEEHCRAAWSYINQEKNAAKYSSEHLAAIKGRIRSAAKRYGIEISDDASRAAPTDRPVFERDWTLDGIEIMRTGDGRTVEAYATPFDTWAEIRDAHGHYEESVARTAFNRTLSHGIDKVGVYYHHGMTLHGTPSDLGSVPLGRPMDIQADGKGLRTVTRYNKSQLADSVLEAIRNGDIRGYSFRGRIYQSNPQRMPRIRSGQSLPRVTRTELGLTEYGPTPTPAYEGAAIMAVRSVVEASLASLDDDDREDLVRLLTATPNQGLGAEDPHDVHSARLRMLRLRAETLFSGVSSGT